MLLRKKLITFDLLMQFRIFILRELRSNNFFTSDAFFITHFVRPMVKWSVNRLVGLSDGPSPYQFESIFLSRLGTD
jgi:hypothetical protein